MGADHQSRRHASGMTPMLPACLPPRQRCGILVTQQSSKSYRDEFS
jgi:hypothetical protein